MTQGKLEWFGGNKDALDMFELLIELAHIWDDIVDTPETVTSERKDRALFIAMVALPANKFYSMICGQIYPMWVAVLSAYTTANNLEREGDAHGLEIAHGLRYAAGHIVSYMVYICLGVDGAAQVMPEIWKTMMPERFEDYKKEHSDEENAQVLH